VICEKLDFSAGTSIHHGSRRDAALTDADIREREGLRAAPLAGLLIKLDAEQLNHVVEEHWHKA
jgi:hypothetical protein